MSAKDFVRGVFNELVDPDGLRALLAELEQLREQLERTRRREADHARSMLQVAALAAAIEDEDPDVAAQIRHALDSRQPAQP